MPSPRKSSSTLSSSPRKTSSTSSSPRKTPSPKKTKRPSRSSKTVDAEQDEDQGNALQAALAASQLATNSTGPPTPLADGEMHPSIVCNSSEILYNSGASPLFTSIEETRWSEALELLDVVPEQAGTWVKSTGTENTTFGWSLWQRLPIHEVCMYVCKQVYAYLKAPATNCERSCFITDDLFMIKTHRLHHILFSFFTLLFSYLRFTRERNHRPAVAKHLHGL